MPLAMFCGHDTALIGQVSMRAHTSLPADVSATSAPSTRRRIFVHFARAIIGLPPDPCLKEPSRCALAKWIPDQPAKGVVGCIADALRLQVWYGSSLPRLSVVGRAHDRRV